MNGWPKSFLEVAGTDRSPRAFAGSAPVIGGDSPPDVLGRLRKAAARPGGCATSAPHGLWMWIGCALLKVEVLEHASGRMASTVDVRFWRGVGHVADDWPQRHLRGHHA